MTASETVGRTLSRLPALSRRRCVCGLRATHQGLADGTAVMYGCSWCAHLWRRDPDAIHRLAVYLPDRPTPKFQQSGMKPLARSEPDG